MLPRSTASPASHHQRVVGHARDDGEIVADEDQGHVPVGDQAIEEREHLGLDGHVEGGGGLVRDEQSRPAGERHGDGHPLSLPAGDLVGARRRDALGLRQAHLVERRRGRPA